jgi:putative membrane protein
MRKSLLLSALVAGLGLAASAQTADQFVKEAAVGGMTEVDLGKLAKDKGSSDTVKQFGQKMVDDHSRINDDLKTVAKKKNIDLPTALDAKHQAVVDRLSKLSGAEFDRAYSTEMVRDHQEDVKEFQKQANSASDPDVKSFASNNLPTLQEHLKMAKDMSKGKPSRGTSDRSKQ